MLLLSVTTRSAVTPGATAASGNEERKRSNDPPTEYKDVKRDNAPPTAVYKDVTGNNVPPADKDADSIGNRNNRGCHCVG